MTNDKFKIMVIIGVWVIAITLVILCFRGCRTKDNSTSPVKEIHKIDSIKKENKALIDTLDKINNIKEDEIHAAENLDDDSTLRLFYNLLRGE